MPRFSFTNSDKVVRVTPRAAAARVMVKPKGSMHWRNTKPPGWGGFFIGMAPCSFLRFLVVIVVDFVSFGKHALVQDARNHNSFLVLAIKHNMPAALHSAQAGTDVITASTQRGIISQHLTRRV
jgi:hypothetical protein